jgi:hypothetical protein
VELAPRNERVGLALAGLLVLLASSSVSAWGRKPPKEEEVRVHMRRITGGELMDILRVYPGEASAELANKNHDTTFFAHVFPLSEVTAASLKRAFPSARFYRGLYTAPRLPGPYLFAVADDKPYLMPRGFTRLLSASSLKVADSNAIALAKAFVILAAGSQSAPSRYDSGGPEGEELLDFPHIAFLDSKLADQPGRRSGDAWLKVDIDGDIQEWEFSRSFAWIPVKDTHGPIKTYGALERLTWPPERIITP